MSHDGAFGAEQRLVQRGGVGRFTVWDARVALRAVAVAALAFGMAWVVTATTDEGGLAWGVRIGRSLPVAPACAAVGAAIALAPARARGELRALASLGRSPFESAFAAAVGGAVVALVAAVIVGADPVGRRRRVLSGDPARRRVSIRRGASSTRFTVGESSRTVRSRASLRWTPPRVRSRLCRSMGGR